MKRRKWVKWGVGAGSTLAFAVLLNTIRTDAAFDAAYQQATASKASQPGVIDSQTSGTDTAFQEWKRANDARNNSGNYSGSGSSNDSQQPQVDRSRKHRPSGNGAFGGGSTGSGSTNNGGSMGVPDTRSSHS
jgi:hypothetical protein